MYREAREQTKKIVDDIKNAFVEDASYQMTKSSYNEKLDIARAVTDPAGYAAALTELSKYANMYLDQTVALCEKYMLANETYRAAILSDESLSDARKQELIAYIDSIDVNLICTGNDPKVVIDQAIADYAAIYDAALAAGAEGLPGWSCPEGALAVAIQDGKWQELGRSNTEIWRHLSACPGLLSFGTLDG